MSDATTLRQIAAHLRAGDEAAAEQLLPSVTARRAWRARACWRAPVYRARRFEELAQLADNEDAQGPASRRSA